MNITKNEAAVLNEIAYAEHNASNGARPESHKEVNTWLFVDEIAVETGLSKASVKGVVSSLVKKELVVVTQQAPDPDNSVSFTELGYEKWATVDDDRTGVFLGKSPAEENAKPARVVSTIKREDFSSYYSYALTYMDIMYRQLSSNGDRKADDATAKQLNKLMYKFIRITDRAIKRLDKRDLQGDTKLAKKQALKNKIAKLEAQLLED